MYARGAAFSSQPFRGQQAPSDYVAWAFDDQESAECRFGSPLVDGSRATVEWWAVVTPKDASVETLAGASFLRFDGEGLVLEQRDVWAAQEGRHELPDWASRG